MWWEPDRLGAVVDGQDHLAPVIWEVEASAVAGTTTAAAKREEGEAPELGVEGMARPSRRRGPL